MQLGPKLRHKFYYTVEQAGRMDPLFWSKTESHRGVRRGDIPAERDGRFWIVPKQPWDTKLKKLRQKLRKAGLKRRRPEPGPALPKPTATKARKSAVKAAPRATAPLLSKKEVIANVK